LLEIKDVVSTLILFLILFAVENLWKPKHGRGIYLNESGYGRKFPLNGEERRSTFEKKFGEMIQKSTPTQRNPKKRILRRFC